MTTWESGLLLAGVVAACVTSARGEEKPTNCARLQNQIDHGAGRKPDRLQRQGAADRQRRQQVRLHAAV